MILSVQPILAFFPRLHRFSGGPARGIVDEERETGWWRYTSLWLLSYLAWQAIVYIHSYWRSTAVIAYGASARDIVVADLVIRSTSLVGRIIWGFAIDSYGWKITWTAVSLTSLIVTTTLTHFYQNSFTLYSVW